MTAQNRTFANAQEFTQLVSRFAYQVTTWKEAQELGLDEIGFTEEHVNTETIQMTYDNNTNGKWTEGVSWRKGNIGDASDIGDIDVATVWEVYERGRQSGKITEIECRDEF